MRRDALSSRRNDQVGLNLQHTRQLQRSDSVYTVPVAPLIPSVSLWRCTTGFIAFDYRQESSLTLEARMALGDE